MLSQAVALVLVQLSSCAVSTVLDLGTLMLHVVTWGRGERKDLPFCIEQFYDALCLQPSQLSFWPWVLVLEKESRRGRMHLVIRLGLEIQVLT